jgi:hypothetical protein
MFIESARRIPLGLTFCPRFFNLNFEVVSCVLRWKTAPSNVSGEAFIREDPILKTGIVPMKLHKIIFETCPRCQSTFINRVENEHPTWQCSDCLYTFEVPLIAKFPDPETKDTFD